MEDSHHRVVVGRHDGVRGHLDPLGLNVEEAHGEASRLAGEPPAAQQGDRLVVGADADAAAEEELHRFRRSHREGAGVLEEERALLGEEKIEAGQVDLLLVGLDLGEVGVIGEIGRQARRHPELGVGAELGRGVGRGGIDVVAVQRPQRRRGE